MIRPSDMRPEVSVLSLARRRAHEERQRARCLSARLSRRLSEGYEPDELTGLFLRESKAAAKAEAFEEVVTKVLVDQQILKLRGGGH